MCDATKGMGIMKWIFTTPKAMIGMLAYLAWTVIAVVLGSVIEKFDLTTTYLVVSLLVVIQLIYCLITIRDWSGRWAEVCIICSVIKVSLVLNPESGSGLIKIIVSGLIAVGITFILANMKSQAGNERTCKVRKSSNVETIDLRFDSKEWLNVVMESIFAFLFIPAIVQMVLSSLLCYFTINETEIYDSINFSCIMSNMICYFVVMSIIHKNKIELFTYCTERKKLMVTNLIYVILIFILIIILEELFIIASEDLGGLEKTSIEQAEHLYNGSLNFILLNVGIIGPILEEVVFRGAIFAALRARFSFSIATLVSSLLFGAAHLNLTIGAVTFMMGIVMCCIMERTRNILYCIILHALNNIVSVVTAGYPSISISIIPENRIVAVILLIMMIALLIVILRKLKICNDCKGY